MLREYGILLRDSDLPHGLTRARDLLEEAITEVRGRDEAICRHALGDVYMRLSAYLRAVEVLEPLLAHPDPVTRQKTYPLLQQLYQRIGEHVKGVELRDRMARDDAAK